RLVSLWVMMWLSVVRDAEVGLPGMSGLSVCAAGAWSVMASTLCRGDMRVICVSFATAPPLFSDDPCMARPPDLHTGAHERLARGMGRQPRRPLRTRERERAARERPRDAAGAPGSGGPARAGLRRCAAAAVVHRRRL